MQLKPPTLVRDYDYVFPADPALDHEAQDFGQLYREANVSGDWSNVPLKGNRKPVVWKLQHLRAIPKCKIQDLLNDDVRAGREQASFVTLWHACRFALKGVDGLDDHNGLPAELPRVSDPEWGKQLSVTPKYMERLAELEIDSEVVGDSLIREIGGEAILRMLPGKR